MATDDPPKDPSLADRLAAEAAAAAAQKSVEAMARGAMAAVGKAADSALDAIEKMLFGKVGGADEAVAKEKIADPVERFRAEYDLGSRPPEAAKKPTKLDPAEEARRQLEELKKARDTRSEMPLGEPTERKRTL